MQRNQDTLTDKKNSSMFSDSIEKDTTINGDFKTLITEAEFRRILIRIESH
jgi:hypothetical protein